MAENTKIEWTATELRDGTRLPGFTFNPWRGCTKVSTGCTNCYAEKQAKRNPSVLGIWGDKGTRVVASEAMWRKPLQWNREAEAAGLRRKVFCASMADVFEDRPELLAPRARLFGLITSTPHLDWLVLTKRPENVARLMDRIFDAPKRHEQWPCVWWHRRETGVVLPNVWIGTSVEDQAAADERIPVLADIPAAVRFLSCEPLLGSIELEGPLDGAGVGRPWLEWLDWVIVGGESGPKARPCNVNWIRGIVEQCREAAVPVFVKQLGARPQHTVMTSTGPRTVDGVLDRCIRCDLDDPKGGDPEEWPADLRVREFPTVEVPGV